MYLVIVKYIGKSMDIVIDYNGKRYCFSKSNAVQKIPVEVYNFVHSSNHMYKDSLIPLTEDNSETVEALQKKIKELEDKIAGMVEPDSQDNDRDNSPKKRGRPKKD